MKREFIFLGPPACGKGAQTEMLSKYMKLPHVDTGSLLRAEINNNTDSGKEAKSYIERGLLVPVELVAKIIKNRLSQSDCANGYILDGFPRSTEQADELFRINEFIDGGKDTKFTAVYFDINTDLLEERIVNRRSCPQCGTIYNLQSKPPKIKNHCDNDGSELVQRKDDTREVAHLRFETYNKETAPLITYYQDKGVLRTINANGNIQEVWERLLAVVND